MENSISIITKRASKELVNGSIVNLGIGLPTNVVNHIPPSYTIWLHSENGVLGMKQLEDHNKKDADLINAGKQVISTIPGSSFFSSATSFSMIRGKHIDVAILGAMEVSQYGDVANWMIPNKKVQGMGGAMDLVHGAKKIIIVMRHCSKFQQPKLLRTCNLPITGYKCANLIITEFSVFIIRKSKFHLIEILQNCSLSYIKKTTQGEFTVDNKVNIKG
jgi:3-oxoacid CoA-transferase subunit B